MFRTLFVYGCFKDFWNCEEHTDWSIITLFKDTFLWTGATWAIFNESGKMDLDNDKFTRLVMGLVTTDLA